MSIFPLLAFLALSVSGRIHGSGWFPYSRVVATVIVGLGFGIAAWLYWGTPWAALGGIISAAAFTLGHGNFYAMKGAAKPDNPELIERYLARPLWDLTGRGIHSPPYSQWCMAVKWGLVGLCVWPLGLILAFTAPLFYTASFRKTSDSESAEWMNGIMAGLVVAIIFAGAL